jgi:hypothetical protein
MGAGLVRYCRSGEDFGRGESAGLHEVSKYSCIRCWQGRRSFNDFGQSSFCLSALRKGFGSLKYY